MDKKFYEVIPDKAQKKSEGPLAEKIPDKAPKVSNAPFAEKIPAKKSGMRAGGYVKSADGCAMRGKTRGKMV